MFALRLSKFLVHFAGALVCTVVLSVPSFAQALALTGQWYDRQHIGHGLDLNHVVTAESSTLFGTFFTYAADGRPQWLWLIEPETAAPSGALSRLNRQADGRIRSEAAGSFSLTPVTRCADGLPRPGARALLEFRASLAEGDLLWCIEPVLPDTDAPESALDGHWYSENPEDFGVGLISHFYRRAGDNNGIAQGFHFIYFYDADGFPRWAVANGQSASFRAEWDFYTLRGSCFGCPTQQLSELPIGRAEIRLSSVNARTPQSNHIRVSLRFDERSVFNQNAALKLLSSPNRVQLAASTSEGVVSGTRTADIERFSNIPFAAPPLSERRFRAPALPAEREKILDAHTLGPACMQPEGQSLFGSRSLQQSEDCLQLNIWRPAEPAAAPRAVMFWIHGGGLTIGSAVEQLNGRLIYSGEAFAGKSVVLVSLNYRLGAFGYMAPRGAPGDASEPTIPANAGLLDQIAALKWVQQNISQFGGDPSNITIFGESAGGVSVCALLSSPLARGLFHRAIAQSGNCLQNLPSLESAHLQAERVAQRLGCNEQLTQLACLRSVSAAELLAASQAVISGISAEGESYGLTLDGNSLTQTPAAALRSGSAAQIALILGVTDDESTSLSPASSLPNTQAGYEALIRQQFPLISSNVLARYPASNYPTPQRAYQDLIDDVRFTCANRRAAFDHAARGNRVFHYVLTDSLPEPQLAPLESFHGIDISYLFGRTGALAPELALSAKMRSAWVNFAQTGEPGNALGYAWPRYGLERLSAELNHSATTPISDYRREYCEFWANYVAL